MKRIVVFVLSCMLLCCCSSRSDNLSSLQAHGESIVAAMKQYEKDTGMKFRGDLAALSPKYLPQPFTYGYKPGQWYLGSGWLTGQSDDIVLVHVLREVGADNDCYVFTNGQGWTRSRIRARDNS